ncbi:MAG TPA: serine/threonine-protein kinase [Polyangiales bacterium]|nr:serine/threonine-protein kinase [Polyangiales bacterium]
MSPGAALATPTLPRAFGKYLLFDCIGRGGVAEIFLARMTAQLGGARRVVVKQILPELSLDRHVTRAFVREAKLVTRLNHRNIVRVFDLGRESGRLYIAMEYVEGYDLNQLLGQLTRLRLPLPAEFALCIAREVLAGLDYAHRARDQHGTPLGVVHRDVSPSNVLISFEGEVMLCDFGIARAFHREHSVFGPASDPEGSRVRRIRAAGKSGYMAPEHARGEEVDARSDLFAAGILLWELCAGRRLYTGDEQTRFEQAVKAEIPPLPERGLPKQKLLQAILDRALAADPAVRYQSAQDMLNDLEDYALSTQLMASQLRFAAFLTQHLADEILELRRARERAAERARSR